MEQPRDAVVHHDLPQVLVVQDVSKDKRTWREMGAVGNWLSGVGGRKVLHEAQAGVSTT